MSARSSSIVRSAPAGCGAMRSSSSTLSSEASSTGRREGRAGALRKRALAALQPVLFLGLLISMMMQSACSLMAVRSVDYDRVEADCTTSHWGPGWDVGWSAAAIATSALATVAASENQWSEGPVGVGVASAVVGGAFLTSAIWGFTETGKCRERYRAEGRVIPSGSLSGFCSDFPGGAGAAIVGLFFCAVSGIAAAVESSSSKDTDQERRRPKERAAPDSQVSEYDEPPDAASSSVLYIEHSPGTTSELKRGDAADVVSPERDPEVERCARHLDHSLARCEDGSHACVEEREEASRDQGGVAEWLER